MPEQAQKFGMIGCTTAFIGLISLVVLVSMVGGNSGYAFMALFVIGIPIIVFGSIGYGAAELALNHPLGSAVLQGLAAVPFGIGAFYTGAMSIEEFPYIDLLVISLPIFIICAVPAIFFACGSYSAFMAASRRAV